MWLDKFTGHLRLWSGKRAQVAGRRPVLRVQPEAHSGHPPSCHSLTPTLPHCDLVVAMTFTLPLIPVVTTMLSPSVSSLSGLKPTEHHWHHFFPSYLVFLLNQSCKTTKLNIFHPLYWKGYERQQRKENRAAWGWVSLLCWVRHSQQAHASVFSFLPGFAHVIFSNGKSIPHLCQVPHLAKAKSPPSGYLSHLSSVKSFSISTVWDRIK